MSARTIHYEVLPNGLTLLLHETHRAPVASLQIWANVGSADERGGEEGLAHFHEHMLFKGTKRRGVGEVAGDVEGAGGRINAYTSFDVTVYYATLPADALSTGLDVLTDALRHSIFDPDEVKREREVVLEEIRRSDDSPGHVLSDEAFRQIYREHPYGKPILGPSENVARFDKPMVEAFFRRWYTPEHMSVVAVGDFDAREFASEIAAAFEDAEPGGATRSRTPEPAQTALRCFAIERGFDTTKLDLSWRGTTFRDDDAAALDLAAFVLGEADSSRLVRRVKEEEQLADRIDASNYTPLDEGVFGIAADVDPENAEATVEACLREVERLRCDPVSDEELERARANFLASEHFERESVSGLAGKLGNFEFLGGGWQSEERYLEQIQTLTPADVQRVVRERLAPERLTIGALFPQGAGCNAQTLEAAAERGVRTTRKQFAVPERIATSTSKGTTHAPGPEIHSFELPNGLAVHVTPRPGIPVVAMRASFLGGLLSEDPASSGLSVFASSMWTRGTRSHSAADYARAVETIAAEVDGFSGRNSIGMTLESTSDQLDRALDLFSEALLAPALLDEEVERERRDTLAAIERRADRLAQRAFLLFSRTLFERHPYRQSMIGETESVERFQADDVRAHYERLVRGPGGVVGVAGDVDPEAVARALSVRLSGLRRDASPLAARPSERAPTEARRAHEVVDREQSHLVLGFLGLTIDDPDRFALEVIAQLLAGQGGRLFLELRDRQSLAYTVTASNVEGVDPGTFSLYIATAPEKLGEAREGLHRELERLVSQAPSHDELERARRYLIGNEAIDAQRASSAAAHLSLGPLYGLPVDEHFRYGELVGAVTADDVLRVARRVIDLDAPVEALVGPEV